MNAAESDDEVQYGWREICPKPSIASRRRGAYPTQMVPQAVDTRDHFPKRTVGVAARFGQSDAKRGQWRLKPMREISDVPSGVGEAFFVLVDQRIEFDSQRSDLAWLIFGNVPGTTLPDAGQVPAQCAQRLQAEAQLH